MNQNKPFEEDISQWFSSLDFNCQISSGSTDRFKTLVIHKEERLLLEAKLVNLNSWDPEASKEELNNYQNRQIELRKAGISTIILWEDLWNVKKEIVKSRIKSILGISGRIPGRLTKVVRIDKATASDFLAMNHLQAYVQAKYKYGLYLPAKYFRVLPPNYQLDAIDEKLLVAVATFSRPRIFTKEEKPFRSYELIRFASLLNITVVGGLDKLVNSFTKEIEPDDIMTYADKEWSDGTSYERLGFNKISEIGPVKFLLNLESNERLSIQKSVSDTHSMEICNGGSIKFVKSIDKKRIES